MDPEIHKLRTGLEEIQLGGEKTFKRKSKDEENQKTFKRKNLQPTVVWKKPDKNNKTRRLQPRHDKEINELPFNTLKINKEKGEGELKITFFGKKKQRIVGLKPEQYTIQTSTIPNAGNGAFTNIYLSKGTVLGNYKGKRLSKQQYNHLKDQSYIWELSSRNGPIYIDGKNPKLSNWLRFLNDSRDKRINVEPYQYRSNIYYRTIKNIQPGKELFISYGDSYWD